MGAARWFTIAWAMLLAALPGLAGDTVKARIVQHVNPPFCWLENGQWRGMDMDFYEALEKEAKIPFVYEQLPWSRGIDYLKAGKCDIMTQLSKTPERETYMHFLGPYTQEEMVLVVKKDRVKSSIASLDELIAEARKSQLLIGIEEDAFYSSELNARLESDPAFKAQFDFGKMTLSEMVLHDRLFACIDRRVVISHQINTIPTYRELAIHPFVIGVGPVYFGVSRKTPEPIVKRLQAACDRLMKNGTFKKIESRWVLR